MNEEFPYKKRIIMTILDSDPGIKKLFLFGSRARQDNRKVGKCKAVDLNK